MLTLVLNYSDEHLALEIRDLWLYELLAFWCLGFSFASTMYLIRLDLLRGNCTLLVVHSWRFSAAIRYCCAWHLVNFFITLTSSLHLNFEMLICFILKIYFVCTTILITVVIRVVLKVFQTRKAKQFGICIQTNTKLHLANY